MTAFVSDGPDIPEHLLEAHEEGEVVFFCGAGISFPAGLPGFGELVEKIYNELGTVRSNIEDQTFNREQYDATLDQLERRIPGQRATVRRALASSLVPRWRRKGATATHEALLQLAKSRDGNVRLVTTNYDHVFERALKRLKLKIPTFSAPLLPIPKQSKWNGLVYLHGLLPRDGDLTELNRLILTSGDFGLAYLTERWASRFVSELFRNYTVCFVGYRINDPVLRYMMDALAADELLGESRLEAFAFAPYEGDGLDRAKVEWKAKGVTPLLYEVTPKRGHAAMHQTLVEWSRTYRDGVRGKQMIVAQHAPTPPLSANRLDFAVGRVLWALTDGLAAKHFAELDPVPPLSWLDPFSEPQFEHRDLHRFGVVPNREEDTKLRFSVLQRPSPYQYSPMMSLVTWGAGSSRWDEVMHQLARWLMRHLNDPKLVLWIVNKGSRIHPNLAMLIRSQLETTAKLQANDKKELDHLLENAPNAVPNVWMRIAWRMILAGRLRTTDYRVDLYDWAARFRDGGMSTPLRFELREILTPRIVFQRPFPKIEVPPDEEAAPARLSDFLRWEIVLSCDYPHSGIAEIKKVPGWTDTLPTLLDDFASLLRDAADLRKELGGSDRLGDLSYMEQPSISEHPQNRDFNDWTVLIELTRDAWLATANTSPPTALRVAESWSGGPYPLFRRMALFAATHFDVVPEDAGLNWLLTENGWWLWSTETQREAIQLVAALGSKLNEQGMTRLVEAILVGPPRDMFKEDTEPEKFERIAAREKWIRLRNLRDVGAVLGASGERELAQLEENYPDWKLTEERQEEFPVWMGEGDEFREYTHSPRRRRELAVWLLTPPDDGFWKEDDWRERCRDNFSTAASALMQLATEGKWPEDRWGTALQAWSEERHRRRSWRYLGKVVANAPDELFETQAHAVSYWLRDVAPLVDLNHEAFIASCLRILGIQHGPAVEAEDPVTSAINHPVGHVVDALIRWWYRTPREEGEGLPEELRRVFTDICNTDVAQNRHGRVLLATHAINLFRVDPEWSTRNLLPLFSWQRDSAEARAAWEGFLWSPRLYRSYLEATKAEILETSGHYAELGRHSKQFASYLTYISLDRGDTFSALELAEATVRLPLEGFKDVVDVLSRALNSAGEQRVEYWRNRVAPYLHEIWPKDRDLVTATLAEPIANLCLAADAAFPEAMHALEDWLLPIEHADFVARRLLGTTICDDFPSEALRFLDSVFGEEVQWMAGSLNQCLQRIHEADPTRSEDPRYLRLAEISQRHDRD